MMRRLRALTSLWRHYLATRFRPRVSVVLPLAIVVAALPSLGPPVWALAVDGTVALLFVLSLRVWDDWQDRAVDAQRAPERLMVRVPYVGPFLLLGGGAALLGCGLVALTRPASSLFVLVGTYVLLAVWYRLRPAGERAGGWGIAANYHVVLLKYPVLALVVASRSAAAFPGGLAIGDWAGPAALYLGLCLYEYFDDERCRRNRLASACAVVAGLLLAGGLLTGLTRLVAG